MIDHAYSGRRGPVMTHLHRFRRFCHTIVCLWILSTFGAHTVEGNGEDKVLQLNLQRTDWTRSDTSDAMQLGIHRRLSLDPPVQSRQDDARGSLEELSQEYKFAMTESPLRVGYGTHYAELYLGIPAQRASVIVDTGSRFTALPCISCADCGTHTDPLFDMNISTTAAYVECNVFPHCSSCSDGFCHVRQSYTEGSKWQAVVMEDLAWLGVFNHSNVEPILRRFGIKFPFGCQSKETGLFVTQKANGIMGFGRQGPTFVPYLLAEGRIDHHLFSMCFGRKGGALTLGGIDYSLHNTSVAYAPLQPTSKKMYPVYIKRIFIGDKPLDITSNALNSGKGVIVDSGTTDTYFVASAKHTFESTFAEASRGIEYDDSLMSIDLDDLQLLPNVTIVIAGMSSASSSGDIDSSVEDDDVQLVIPPSKYLSLRDDGKSLAGNMHFSERSGGVLGASVMMGLDVIFDVENDRLGFAEANCDRDFDVNGMEVGTEEGTLNDTKIAQVESEDEEKEAIWIAVCVLVGALFAIVMIVMAMLKCSNNSDDEWQQVPADSAQPSGLKSGLHKGAGTPPLPGPRCTIDDSEDEEEVKEDDKQVESV